MKSNRFKLQLDTIMLIVLVMLMVPAVLGDTLHEWIGLGLGAVFLFHKGLNWKWIKNITRKFHRRLPPRERINYLLNLLLFIGFTFIILSGMYISKAIDFSWLGISSSHNSSWKIIHTSVSYITFLIAGIHLGLNFRWVKRALGKRRNTAEESPIAISKYASLNMLLMIIILLAGVYSFVHLDYINKADPAALLTVINSDSTSNIGYPGDGNMEKSFGPGGGREEFSYRVTGLHGGEGDFGRRSAPAAFTEIFYFLGVFIMMTALTNRIDQGLLKRKKVLDN